MNKAKEDKMIEEMRKLATLEKEMPMLTEKQCRSFIIFLFGYARGIILSGSNTDLVSAFIIAFHNSCP
jgi:hypothetical protein